MQTDEYHGDEDYIEDESPTCTVKLDLGLTEKQAEYLVDKYVMPFLFPNWEPK